MRILLFIHCYGENKGAALIIEKYVQNFGRDASLGKSALVTWA
jgi:hypothetical protein